MTEGDLTAALAVRLYGLRQRPDGNGSWVKHVVKALDTNEPSLLSEHWKRLGFTRDLAGLAALAEVDTASLALAFFFEGLLAKNGAKDRKRPGAWIEFFRLNASWLDPSIGIIKLVRQDEPASSRIEAVAAIAASYLRKTRRDHVRPITALTELRDEARTDAEAEIVELLWSEEGQNLYDRHFRAEKPRHRMTAKELREAIVLLKSSKPAGSSESSRPATHERPSRDNAHHTSKRRESMPADLDSFERRKAQLRRPAQEVQTESVATPSPPVAVDGTPAPIQPTETTPETDLDPHVRRDPGGEAMVSNTAPRAQDGRPAIDDRLDQLRIRLVQLNTISSEALELLQALEPDIARHTAVATELNALVQRLQGHSGATSDAA